MPIKWGGHHSSTLASSLPCTYHNIGTKYYMTLTRRFNSHQGHTAAAAVCRFAALEFDPQTAARKKKYASRHNFWLTYGILCTYVYFTKRRLFRHVGLCQALQCGYFRCQCQRNSYTNITLISLLPIAMTK